MANLNARSPHTLNASSNLLGICFVVLTSLKILKISDKTVIDECTVVATILFMASCSLSFLSIRNHVKNSVYFEKVADFCFLAGMLTIFVTTLLFSFNLIK